MKLDVERPRPLLPGDEVWFQVVFYEARIQRARVRYQQCRVCSTDEFTVTVRYYDAPYHEVRKVLRLEQVYLRCPGEPLFSC